ncbi:hypothetical protein [Vibrio tetraodonis]|uniref:hypothetical protein n=1 Tax=Vibrio tetraodonis TaxID=2231647 RepID=UPI000E0A5C4F|nr:hypothetical protein [Vibrio tetraodonis]
MNESWANFFPYFAGAFKLIILGIGAFLAIKWHFDEEIRVRQAEGMVFDNNPSLMKKLAMKLSIPFFLSFLILVVIYLTDRLLY